MSKKDIGFKNRGIFPNKETEWLEEDSVIPLNERSIGITPNDFDLVGKLTDSILNSGFVPDKIDFEFINEDDKCV